MRAWKEFVKGIWEVNPVFKLVLGMCPALAVTTAAVNGLAMGLATTFVLISSNVVIASLRNIIPARVRIPSFIVVIASFVTIVDLVMAGFFFEMHRVLGIFIPLIVVNCVILGRAEAFASRNPVLYSAIDGLGMGTGFTLSLVLLGVVRELLGSGSIFGITLFGKSYLPVLVMILPPGAFISLGVLLGMMNLLENRFRA